MPGANGCSTPADVNVQLFKNENDIVMNIPHKEVVGALLFLTSISRADISFAVNLVCRYVGNTGKTHLNAVKLLIHCLICTKFVTSTSHQYRIGKLFRFRLCR